LGRPIDYRFGVGGSWVAHVIIVPKVHLYVKYKMETFVLISTFSNRGGLSLAMQKDKTEGVNTEKVVKDRMTFHLPVKVIDRAKNAVYWIPGLTLADLAAEAIDTAVDKLEKKNGRPFQRREGDLKGGRPIK
jgi:hypothetical protein